MIKSSQRGFTLIELVVVIVILGILAAFAVPRFMGLEGKAREASIKALQGSVKSAAMLAHSTQLAQGKAKDESITIGSATITMSNRYPTAADIDKTLADMTGFTYAAGKFSKTGGPDTCAFTYAPPATLGDAPTFGAIGSCE